MRSIKRRFQAAERKNPGWAPLICFSNAVAEQGFTPDTISRWFNELIDPEEYQRDPKAKKEWMAHFLQRTKKVLRTTEISHKSAQGRSQRDFTASTPHLFLKRPNTDKPHKRGGGEVAGEGVALA